jgi:hypothetical protein
MTDDSGQIGIDLRLKMNPHPIEHRLGMLGVTHIVTPQVPGSVSRPLSERIVEQATHQGLKIRAYEVYRLLKDQLEYFRQSALSQFPNALDFRDHDEHRRMTVTNGVVAGLPSDDLLQALEMTFRYLADDISVCRKAIDDFRVILIDEALKTEPKK